MANDIVNDAELTDQAALDFFDQVLTCEPLVSAAEVDEMANMVHSPEHFTRFWRMAVASASKGGDFYKGVSENQEQAKGLMIDVVPRLQEFQKTLREMADLTDCAAMRIVVAASNHEASTEW